MSVCLRDVGALRLLHVSASEPYPSRDGTPSHKLTVHDNVAHLNSTPPRRPLAHRYLVLSPAYSTPDAASSDVATLVAATQADRRLGDLPAYKQLLSTFTNQEIIRWGLFQVGRVC